MMRLLNPSWLWLSLLALPILILYMLKLRRREVPVSSILLWERLLRDRQANTPWQRLRRNLLLFLQLLILAGLILGLSRPATMTRSVATGSLVVLLDASASMNATDVKPSRFEAARSAARSLINELDSNARMTLLLVTDQPQVLASAETDRGALRRALDEIPQEKAPTKGSANWQAAFALAAGAAASQAPIAEGASTSIVIISDGGLPMKELPPLPAQVRYLPIGQTGENLAISALALRPGNQKPELFAQVTNYGEIDQTVVLSFFLDDAFYSAHRLAIPAGERASLTLSGLPAGARIYKAQLSNPDADTEALDSFPLDDTAFAVYAPTRSGRALLISPGNLFLEQLLAAMPGITPYRAIPSQGEKIQLPQESFDLYILDGLLPDPLPKGNLLMLNPPSNPLFQAGEVFSDTQQAVVAEHPLTHYVDWSSIHVRQAVRVQLPPWAEVLVQAQGGPLVFAGESQGQRIAVLTFDVHNSDLPLQVTFPILFSNLLAYLVPPGAFEAAEGLQPGEVLRIGKPPAANGVQIEAIAIASPSGKVYTLQPAESGTVFTETDELGVYAVNYLSTGGRQNLPAADFFAVNLFDEGESHIRPAQAIQVGRSTIAPIAPVELGQRELWPWAAGFALLVLMLEWLVYHQRSRFV